MSHTIQGTQFMFHVVGSPVAYRTTTRQVVVCQATCPHDLTTQVIVLRVLQYLRTVFFHLLQQGDGKCIGDAHLLVREVALHGVHHDVGNTASRLVCRQGVGTDGVHDGKLASAEVIVVRPFQFALVFGDDTTATHLATSSRNGEHSCQGQASRGLCLTSVEIPHIAFIRHTQRHTLGGVDYATTAYG